MLDQALGNYRRILATPGAKAFSLAALVGRLPISMVGLGTVLLVEAETGSYALAGLISGTGLLFNALFAVVQGRLVDRHGQSRVLPIAITIWGVGLAVAMISLAGGWPLWTTFVAAAVAGASMPGIGSCVRARWSHVLTDPEQRHTAYALEGVADETVFISGPILVTILATAVSPYLGLATALVVGCAGTIVLAGLRDTEPPAHPVTTTEHDRPRLPWRTIAPLGAVCLALGTLFGAAEVATVAFADEQGAPAMAGPLLALWAAGSLLAGVITGSIAWRRGPLPRLRVGATAMAATMVPLVFVDQLWLQATLLFFGGFAIAPTLIAAMSLAERVLPPGRLTEGMALLHTGIGAGVAPGAALAGVIIDDRGASSAYVVCVVGGLVAMLGAIATRDEAPVAQRPATDASHAR